MCGRYALAGSDAGELQARFGLAEQVRAARRFNVCPTDDVLAVAAADSGEPHPCALHWGLVPFWAKDPGVGARMINARAETVAEKNAYAPSLESRRCLIIADGFYEWQQRGGERKLPHHITRDAGEPFAFAGLWTRWRDRDNERELRSCTILTRAAGRDIEAIHPREPVILAGREQELAWLDPGRGARGALELLGSERGFALSARPVGFAVNRAGHDAEDCLADPTADELAATEPGQGTLL